MGDKNNIIPKVYGRGHPLRVLDPDDLRTKYEKWSDSEFIDAARTIEMLDLIPKIEFIYYHTRRNGLLNVQERTIGGIAYSYGIKIEDYNTAQVVCQMYLQWEKPKQLSARLDDFNFRFSKCENIEKPSFVDAEINKIEVLEKNRGEHFMYGYLNQQAKQHWYFPKLAIWYPRNPETVAERYPLLLYISSVINGASSYLFWVELLKIKEQLYTAFIPNLSNQSGSKALKKSKGKDEHMLKTNEIENFLNDKAINVLNQLKTIYDRAKPKQFSYMLEAMKDLDLLTIDLHTVNVTHLHQALKKIFPSIGARFGLQVNLQKLVAASRRDEIKIKEHREKIKLLIE